MSTQKIKELESVQDRLDQESMTLIREQNKRLHGI